MKQMVLIFGGATGIYIVLAILMGVAPGVWLSSTPPGPNVEPLTELEDHGREIYVSNGCSYCHTQQVRPLPQDRVFGRPSAAGDFAYQTPELLGSQRTGPDLTNIGKRQPSETWQYIHLYNPRAVVPQSIMPPFPWLFKVVDQAPEGKTAVPLPKEYAPEKGVVVPTADGQALVAYLKSLKQPKLPGYEGEGQTADKAADKTGSTGADTGDTSNGDAESGASLETDTAQGETLYSNSCAACHQANGKGLPGAFPPLAGNSAVNDSDPTKHIRVILHGLQGEEIDGQTYGSPMPAFGDQFSNAEIAAVINHERQSWGNTGKSVTPQQVAAERNNAE